jgi:hypothetical protein
MAGGPKRNGQGRDEGGRATGTATCPDDALQFSVDWLLDFFFTSFFHREAVFVQSATLRRWPPREPMPQLPGPTATQLDFRLGHRRHAPWTAAYRAARGCGAHN